MRSRSMFHVLWNDDRDYTRMAIAFVDFFCNQRESEVAQASSKVLGIKVSQSRVFLARSVASSRSIDRSTNLTIGEVPLQCDDTRRLSRSVDRSYRFLASRASRTRSFPIPLGDSPFASLTFSKIILLLYWERH